MLGGHSLSKALLGTALAVSSICSLTFGLFPDEAGQIDWYRSQIGAPKKLVPYTHNNATGIFAITERNVLASLNPNSGDIIWRQIFENNEMIHTLRLRDGQALTLSGHNESFVRVWDTMSGSLLWDFVQPAAKSFQPGSGAAEFLHESKDVVAVAGDSLVRLTPSKTTPIWELSLNGTAVYKRIVVQDKVAFVIGDARQTKKQPKARLHVVEVDLATGVVKQQYDVAEGKSLGNDNLVVLESQEYGGYIVWREEKNIVWLIHRLGLQRPMWETYHAKLIQLELMPEDMLTSTIAELDADPGLTRANPRFALTYTKAEKTKTLAVEMFRSGNELDMRKLTGFRSGDAVVAGSHGSPTGEDGKSRNEFSVVSVRSSDAVAWRVYTKGKTPTHTGEFTYDAATYGPIASATLFYSGEEPRVLVQTSGGLVAALAPGDSAPVWFRDESLAHANSMAFLELPAPVSSAGAAAKATDPSVLSSPIQRYILRWAQTVQSLISWTASGFGLFGSSSDHSAGFVPQSVAESLVPKAPLVEGDHFGFRKLSIFGTSTGIVAALSTESGVRSWTRYVTDNGAPVSIENVYITRRSQPLATAAPLVTVVGRNSEGSTVISTLDALTGKQISDGAQHTLSLKHVKILELPAIDPLTGQHLLGLVSDGEKPQLKVWPPTLDSAKALCATSDSFYFDLGDHSGSKQLRGYRVDCASIESADSASWNEEALVPVSRQWAFDLPRDETLIKATGYRDGESSSALVGRVLGDRTVLYKYLNPHLVTLATQRANAGGIGIYLIDRVSGRLLYTTAHEKAVATEKQPFLALQTENRVIYQFWQDGIPESSPEGAKKRSKSTKGYITVVAELFESEKADAREESKAFSSFDLFLPHVISSAFASPEPASALGVTRTNSDTTTRDVVFGLDSGKLLSLPDQLFDPRRPTKAPTSDEQAEGLLPYGPFLPLDPKRVLSHYNTVAGIRFIKAAPTHLESTSLVSSFGLDLFFTRTSPSGTFDQLSPNFSKVNLVVTTLALVVGCLLGGPMVRRKLTNQAWA
ncbi:DUF1620-domain-containing protein [Martensiomyces pterosporus]|nr:DUF1620-domain-containing protein [Martensiomyces pterosporus]